MKERGTTAYFNNDADSQRAAKALRDRGIQCRVASVLVIEDVADLEAMQEIVTRHNGTFNGRPGDTEPTINDYPASPSQWNGEAPQ